MELKHIEYWIILNSGLNKFTKWKLLRSSGRRHLPLSFLRQRELSVLTFIGCLFYYMLVRLHVIDHGHSDKSADYRLHLSSHTLLTWMSSKWADYAIQAWCANLSAEWSPMQIFGKHLARKERGVGVGRLIDWLIDWSLILKDKDFRQNLVLQSVLAKITTHTSLQSIVESPNGIR